MGMSTERSSPKIVTVASGKGGVGKTTLVANLAYLLASQGRKVLAVDLDLGGSNLHTLLGVKNSTEGLAAFLTKKKTRLDELIHQTGFENLFLIPGDGLIPGLGNIPFYLKKRMRDQLQKLPFDVILIDLGAGTSLTTLDFFLWSPLGLVITVPETTAILNAYLFFKAAFFRLVALAFPAKSEERRLIDDFVQEKIEGSGHNVTPLLELLGQMNPEAEDRALEALAAFRPAILLNQVQGPEEWAMGRRLHELIQKNLEFEPAFLGGLAWDELGREAVNQRRPLVDASPEGSFTRQLTRLAEDLIKGPAGPGPQLYWDDLAFYDTESEGETPEEPGADEVPSEDSSEDQELSADRF